MIHNAATRTGTGKTVIAGLRARICQILLMTLAIFGYGAHAVHAQDTAAVTAVDSPFKALTVFTSASVASDSNVFRGPLAQSDTITTGRLGLRWDQPWAQQHIHLEATKTFNRYDKFKNLDFDGFNYNGVWNWRLGTRLSGKLSGSRSEDLTPFDSTLSNQRNKRITENQALDVDAIVSGGWHLLLGTSKSNQRSEQNALLNRTPDFDAINGNIGVKYETRAGNTVGANWTKTDGEYINNSIAALNTSYIENLGELTLDWKLTGSSSINGRLGWLNRDNESPFRGDFSGPSGSVNYAWVSGGKLGVTIGAVYRTSPLQTLTADYVEQSTITVTPTWQLSQKSSAYIAAIYQNSRDKGSNAIPTLVQRRDTDESVSVGLRWSATRTLSVDASVQYLQRNSNYRVFEYDATVARMNAALAF